MDTKFKKLRVGRATYTVKGSSTLGEDWALPCCEKNHFRGMFLSETLNEEKNGGGYRLFRVYAYKRDLRKRSIGHQEFTTSKGGGELFLAMPMKYQKNGISIEDDENAFIAKTVPPRTRKSPLSERGKEGVCKLKIDPPIADTFCISQEDHKTSRTTNLSPWTKSVVGRGLL